MVDVSEAIVKGPDEYIVKPQEKNSLVCSVNFTNFMKGFQQPFGGFVENFKPSFLVDGEVPPFLVVGASLNDICVSNLKVQVTVCHQEEIP